jgi:uncharacterized membrane protein YqaE (UPF0057 family)
MPTVPQVKSVKPKRHHGYAFLLFLLGTLFPPLGSSLFHLPCDLILIGLFPAVAARFGIGGDFWLNLVLTLAGYIPGLPYFSSYHLLLLTPSPQATVTTSTFKISATTRIIAAHRNGRSATVSSIPTPSNARNAVHSGQTAMMNALRSQPSRTDPSRRVKFRMQRALTHPQTLQHRHVVMVMESSGTLRKSNIMARAMATPAKDVLNAGIILPTLMTRTQLPR